MSTKLYFFSSGILKTKKHLLSMNRGINEDIDIPVPFFLIKHNGKNILFDTGMAEELISNPKEHWGSAVNAYYPVMKKEDYILEQLKKLDIDSLDIDIVIQSHLHLDHAGAVGKFPNAVYYVQRRELEWAYVPDFYQKSAYIKKDFDKNINWNFLYGTDDDYFDIFGDGVLKIVFTPGHTPGHQSLKVNLKKSGTFILSGDSCYLNEILDDDIMPGLVWSSPDTLKSINKLRYERSINNATIIPGHDPIAWKKYTKAPDYYE